jgi:single-strand DNA-binding protein
MASLNKVQLIGHLGANPEIRRTQDGRPIANMRIATSESWKDKDTGERKERTQWHTVVCFNEGLSKVIDQHLAKGDQVYLEGQLETRKWQDQSGDDRYSTEVVLRPYRGELTILRCKSWEQNRSRQADHDDGGYRTAAPDGGARQDLDDEIPF